MNELQRLQKFAAVITCAAFVESGWSATTTDVLPLRILSVVMAVFWGLTMCAFYYDNGNK